MKKFVLTLVGVIAILTLIPQPPRRFTQKRTLPNQFRDFVDHQQKLSSEKPKIKKENGRVIISMSEAQFDRMRKIRMRQRNVMKLESYRTRYCGKCENLHKKYVRKRLPNSKKRF